MNETTKHPGGRPTKYVEGLTPMLVDAYLQEYVDLGHVIPAICGLSVYMGITRDTIHRWRAEHAEFSDKIDGLLAIQEQMLQAQGLSGTFNSTITKLLLASTHGHHDRSAIDHTTGGKSFKPMNLSDFYGNDETDSKS